MSELDKETPEFNVAPKDCDIPTTHPIGDDIILEEK